MKKLGFTLAEVLITLVIIGVIAAMTVPTLMNNTQGQENKTAFKKAISSMNQALTMEYALEGNTAAVSTINGLPAGNNKTGIAAIMQKRTNVITDLTTADWKATTGAKAFIFSTADGLIYSLPAPAGDSCPGENLSSDATKYPEPNCGIGYVDVNGAKGPNMLVTNSDKPQDVFAFTIYETKVLPGTAPNTVEAAVMYDKKNVSTQSSESV